MWDELVGSLASGGLHDESVERMVSRYTKILQALRQNQPDECGFHIGKFCENAANILHDLTTEKVRSRPQTKELLQDFKESDERHRFPSGVSSGIPTHLEAAYEFRSKRDTVHVNLDTQPDVHDTFTAVQACTWVMKEFVNEYSDEFDAEDIPGPGNIAEYA